jgi:hypothetical protein
MAAGVDQLIVGVVGGGAVAVPTTRFTDAVFVAKLVVSVGVKVTLSVLVPVGRTAPAAGL